MVGGGRAREEAEEEEEEEEKEEEEGGGEEGSRLGRGGRGNIRNNELWEDERSVIEDLKRLGHALLTQAKRSQVLGCRV